ncbi:aminotransferase class V [Thermoanaerobacter ethanolicus JW 200]|nr:aminotransferase class V [Thermoanaerobacter ethanolicus JW 200]
MSPPGLSFVALSERAWKMAETSNLPKYYFNLKKDKRRRFKVPTPTTPATPAVSIIMAVAKATNMLLEMGLDNVYKRQADYGKRVREYVKSLGLELLPEEDTASDLITAIKVPENTKHQKL